MKLKQISNEISKVINQIPQKTLQNFIDEVYAGTKIYIFGEGRSGLSGKAFAVRLARFDKHVYVVGETVTPPITSSSLLIAVSGSGETKTVLETVKISRVMGAKVICLTASPKSSLVKLAHSVILIPVQLPKRLGNIYQLRELVGVPERPVLASIFEIASMIFLEAAAFELENRWSKKNKSKQLLPS